ncbi:MAG: alpha/beta hydrolase [Candidatus Rokubacteria bacterium]|nr:alpha/beta hydrolase [Candidatus Rokubacteria bacterium]
MTRGVEDECQRTDIARTLWASDGAVIAYRLWQPGAPRQVLALLHGLASNMSRWSEFVNRTILRDSWDLLRLDLRGHGLSLYRGRVGMDEWAADLAAILDLEGYPRALVAGHCLGANIAVEFAARYPGKVSGLVLIEPMPREALTGRMRQMARLRPLFVPAMWLIRALNALGIHRRRLAPLNLEELDRETRAALSAGASDALLEQYVSPWLDLRTTPSATYLQALIAVSGRLPDLSAITTPVLALLSTRSTFSDPVLTVELLARFSDCQVVKLDAQHWIPTEQPDAMRRAIEDWCMGLRSRRSA